MPEFTPRNQPSAAQFNPRDQAGLINSTYGELGGSYGAPGGWTYGGLRRSFNSRLITPGTFIPRP